MDRSVDMMESADEGGEPAPCVPPAKGKANKLRSVGKELSSMLSSTDMTSSVTWTISPTRWP